MKPRMSSASKPWEFVAGEAEGGDDLADAIELGNELVGGSLAVGFVVRKCVIAEGGGGSVEGDGDVLGLDLGDDAEEQVDEAVDGVGVLGFAFLVGDGEVGGDGVEGAKYLGHGVDDDEGGAGGVAVGFGQGVLPGGLAAPARAQKWDGRRGGRRNITASLQKVDPA